MRGLIVFSLFILWSSSIFAQNLERIWVEFKDKKDCGFSIEKPEEFLSPRALERRNKQQILIDQSDLPVSPTYVKTLKEEVNQIIYTSKWMNGALVLSPKNKEATIQQLPFVKSTRLVGRYNKPQSKKIKNPKAPEKPYKPKESIYGSGKQQLHQIKGEFLHQKGFRGKGMLIAVLDGGFNNADWMPFFDSLRVNNRMLPGWDFVHGDDFPYEYSSHGTNCLSTMASNLPGLFVGTAPDASYLCLRTEETASELIVEEYNWVAGAEYADSLGADVISSSLGYTQFDKSIMNHSYEDLDGETAIVSIGADMAFSKGMLVINSAGNSGDGKWKYIGAPADADDVISVGSVDRFGATSGFSSFGPTSDGRIKPNTAAKGSATTVASPYGYKVSSSYGTSFSAPIIAGMATSLWQAFPDKTNLEIKNAIEQSSASFDKPDEQLGYGLANFKKAYEILESKSSYVAKNPNIFLLPLVIKENIKVEKIANSPLKRLSIFNPKGQKIIQISLDQNDQFNLHKIPKVMELPTGLYTVEWRENQARLAVKLYKF